MFIFVDKKPPGRIGGGEIPNLVAIRALSLCQIKSKDHVGHGEDRKRRVLEDPEGVFKSLGLDAPHKELPEHDLQNDLEREKLPGYRAARNLSGRARLKLND